ncbi:MAG: dihydrolipoyllysine-residue succinyltransferase [Deltaproteobacteria bacterium HGW-Deltaproteobacteria-14]|jgi:2-oxoglutarate dehydrogenase E2 component (dihydrolipoamide succinyltransferase)|nr:MAG: dihydrolipoyllysine-residue succinyltransferase [Deltaproteobacteria bacterium HGW-Deltaproteobacteria-14]
MATEVKVPALGESITEAVVLEWLVKPGEWVALDQEIVALETDKITVNVPSPVAGVLVEQRVKPDDEVEIGAVIAVIDETAAAPVTGADEATATPPPASRPKPAPAPAPTPTPTPAPAPSATPSPAFLTPAVRRLVHEHGLHPSRIAGTGPGGRILKGDVLRAIDAQASAAPPEPASTTASAAPAPPNATSGDADGSREEVIKMSRLRRTIAERLVAAQQSAAILTTFNEVDMSAVMALRKTYREAFEKQHGVRLGFMSFFAKAAIEALKAVPSVNAEIRGDSVVYKNHYDIGVAVGGGRGLVVPVVKDADRLSFAGFELALNALADKAKNNQLTLDDLTGGTFTLSNGGIYGSLLSTPILNPPQSGILGLHKIEDRPVAVAGQVVVRPMMYLALSYDHRIIDGREAVTFLVRVKECIEDPSRILIEV